MRDAESAFPGLAMSVGEARRFATARLTEWGFESIVDTAELLVSEAVTNAVLHAATPVSVRLHADGGVLRVEVADGSGQLPARKHYGQDATTGRGLMMVEVLALRWGVRSETDGKAVWFELALPGGSPDSAAAGADADTAPAAPTASPPRSTAAGDHDDQAPRGLVGAGSPRA